MAISIKALFNLTTPEIESIGSQFQVDAKTFWEVISPLLKNHLRLKGYKISFDVTEEQLSELIYNLPISKEIAAELLSKFDFNLSEETKTKLQREISFYIYINTIIKVYRNLSIPLMRYFLKSKSEVPLITWARNRFSDSNGEKINFADRLVFQQLDSLFRKLTDEFGEESIYKMGKPNSAIQDNFMNELKLCLKTKNKHYMPKIDQINTFLRENYNSLFNELPVAISSIKQAIERIEKKSKAIVREVETSI